MEKKNNKQEKKDPAKQHFYFYGSATVGERGQVVIPAEARQNLGIKQGDKLLIFSGIKGNSLSVMKAEQVTEFVSRAMEKLARMSEIVREEQK